ncbi:MAG: GIY-YIG nuclease family protein [Candidatus Kaiserbacteria bacterium]|nr:GIY-YIG nuclease family protein [Candidatus Kaiserbacteria bacterium]
MSKNRNDNPLKINDLKKITLGFNDLPNKSKFKPLCNIRPNNKKECLEIMPREDAKDSDMRRRGLVYIFVIGKNLLKVGSTTQNFKERVQSYNCGKGKARKRGTCSTTNYFVLQSLLNFKKEVEVYAFFAPKIDRLVFGKKEKISLPPKQWEKSILKKMKKEDKMPIFCTQT